MRAYVDAASDSRVFIRTPRGTARVTWRGAEAPRSGDLDLELTLKGRIRWAVEASIAGADEPMGVGDDGSLVGRLEAIDPDGVIWLRLAEGLVMAAPEGTAPLVRIGDLVLIRVAEIEAYPVKL